MNKNRGIEIAKILLQAYGEAGIFDKRPPEEIIPNGISKGSREHLLFITLTVALDYMRPAEKLWEASRKTYEDPKTRYLFYPEEVVKKEQSELKRDMLKYKLALRPNKDLKIWKTLCETLNSEYDNNPIKLIEKFNYDALELYKYIGAERSKFPNLRGQKILPLWLRMLNQQVEIKLEKIDKIPIPVDTHVRKASVMLGVTRRCNDNNIIRESWSKILEGTEIYPILLDEPLWILSKYGCSNVIDNNCNLKGDKCPEAEYCPVKNYCILYVGKAIHFGKGKQSLI